MLSMMNYDVNWQMEKWTWLLFLSLVLDDMPSSKLIDILHTFKARMSLDLFLPTTSPHLIKLNQTPWWNRLVPSFLNEFFNVKWYLILILIFQLLYPLK